MRCGEMRRVILMMRGGVSCACMRGGVSCACMRGGVSCACMQSCAPKHVGVCVMVRVCV